MKIKERLKNIGFWISLISAVFLILGAFGVEIGDGVTSTVINALSSLLVVLGVVSDPTTGAGYLDPTTADKSDTAQIEAAEKTDETDGQSKTE